MKAASSSLVSTHLSVIPAPSECALRLNTAHGGLSVGIVTADTLEGDSIREELRVKVTAGLEA